MQVAALVRGRGVLEGGEGGELAGSVGVIGGAHAVAPGGLADIFHQDAVDAAVEQAVQHSRKEGGEGLAPGRQAGFGHVIRVVDALDGFGDVVAGEVAVGIARLLDQAQQHGVIGHRVEIQRPLQLHRVAAGVVHGLTLGIPVGVVGGVGGAEHIGVEGVGGVHVQVAEVGVALGVWGGPELDDLAVHRQQLVGWPGGAGDAHLVVALHIVQGFIRAGAQ